jgi:hypothetical protein
VKLTTPPTSAEVKKMWIHTSTPPYVFMAQCLIKHRDSFTFHTEFQFNTGERALVIRWVGPREKEIISYPCGESNPGSLHFT